MKFNNISWFLIIISSFLIGIWLENGSNTFYEKYIAPIINFQLPLIIFIIIMSVFYRYYNDKILNFEHSIKEYEIQVKDGSRALWKYFKDIGEIKTKQIVEGVMGSFLKVNRHVLAIQIYEYSIRHLKDNTSLYVQHKYSKVSEETDINALLQTYYRIPKQLYDDYISALEILEASVLMQDGIEKVSNWCKEQIELITNASIDELTETDAIRYSLVEIILDIVSFKLDDNFSHDLSTEKLIRLNGLKRTGILKGITVKDFYTFEYTGKSNKNGRKYITKIIEDEEIFNGLPHIILITLNPDYLPEESEDHDKELRELGEGFYQLLKKELKIRYNELTEKI